MKIYIVGGRYCRTQDDARARAKEIDVKFNPESDFDDVPISPAADLVHYLNKLIEDLVAGLPPREAAAPDVVVVTNNVVPLFNSTMVDEAFEGLSVTHQLTLTSLALENARAHIVTLEENARKGTIYNPKAQAFEDVIAAEADGIDVVLADEDIGDEFV